MAPLARRLENSGLPVRRFNYRTTRGDLSAHAARLYDFAALNDAPIRHFVGHSLGGLVILKLLSEHADMPPGRVVFLGSPLQGSAVVQRAEKIPGSAALLGQIRGALETGFAGAPGSREAGMIAGSKSLGLGWMVGGTNGPGDGTVAIAETAAPWLKDHCVLPVTHTGMLYSRAVAEKTARFLDTGGFDGNAA